jgi:hypothetical protein
VARSARPDAKRRAHRFGLRAEWVAAAWLFLKGYRILARRFSVAGGEIDIVARFLWRLDAYRDTSPPPICSTSIERGGKAAAA